jgi:hypothetical protein
MVNGGRIQKSSKYQFRIYHFSFFIYTKRSLLEENKTSANAKDFTNFYDYGFS